MACVLLVVFAVLAVAHAQKPNKPPTYQMNMSTIIMPCNYSGFTDPKTTVGWAIVWQCSSTGRNLATTLSLSLSLLPYAESGPGATALGTPCPSASGLAKTGPSLAQPGLFVRV